MQKSSSFKNLVFDISTNEIDSEFYIGFVNIQSKLPQRIKEDCELQGVVFTLNDFTKKITLINASIELREEIKVHVEKRLI